jgi:hypothetical protein
MMAIGTGIYEIWGTPYDVVHSKNLSEAFDQNAVPWADNPQTIDNDFISDEAMADAMAVRELFYQSNAADRWEVVIAEDYRVEKGDVLGLPDGSNMYVEDFARSLSPRAQNNLTVRGFLV